MSNVLIQFKTSHLSGSKQSTSIEEGGIELFSIKQPSITDDHTLIIPPSLHSSSSSLPDVHYVLPEIKNFATIRQGSSEDMFKEDETFSPDMEIDQFVIDPRYPDAQDNQRMYFSPEFISSALGTTFAQWYAVPDRTAEDLSEAESVSAPSKFSSWLSQVLPVSKMSPQDNTPNTMTRYHQESRINTLQRNMQNLSRLWCHNEGDSPEIFVDPRSNTSPITFMQYYQLGNGNRQHRVIFEPPLLCDDNDEGFEPIGKTMIDRATTQISEWADFEKVWRAKGEDAGDIFEVGNRSAVCTYYRTYVDGILEDQFHYSRRNTGKGRAE